MNLQGKVAIVTGAASGIGHGIAKRYVAAGARVAIADLKADAAEAAAAELTKTGPGEAIGIAIPEAIRNYYSNPDGTPQVGNDELAVIAVFPGHVTDLYDPEGD